MRQVVEEFINSKWDAECVPLLEDYIRIPCQSPAYDKDWETNGLLDQAMTLLHEWVQKQDLPGMTSRVMHEPGRTPFMIIHVPPTNDTATNSILMYGHMDKQPPLLPWAEGLDPYTPVIRDGRLYGRAGADDGYAVCAAITCLQALKKAKVPYGKITIVIEADEESGSANLPFWIDKVKPELGSPDIVVCLDSGALNYDQMWLTNSLRGAVNGELHVEILNEGLHSGIFGNIVPCSFRILRQLISRLECEKTGDVLVPECHAEIPATAVKQFQALDEISDDLYTQDVPLKEGVRALPGKSSELGLANAWKPCLCVTGSGGMPCLATAGNVLRKGTSVMLSMRLPPPVDAATAMAAIQRAVESDPPYGAKVTFKGGLCAGGWSAPEMVPWLAEAVDTASQSFFGRPAGNQGLGGTIPFMGMLGKMFPKAQFVITGVLGPKSNAHGPNEFMDIAFTKKITCCVASIVAAHCRECC
uniref:Peptidase M20 dimerisation domain-containing protein n=1 Tax=Eutreptiella gymnastica TaxID=73025 RepID=A0A7S1IK55_9EUGL